MRKITCGLSKLLKVLIFDQLLQTVEKRELRYGNGKERCGKDDVLRETQIWGRIKILLN